eukprot:4074808-Alexandrium_andersonii.AAC.1
MWVWPRSGSARCIRLAAQQLFRLPRVLWSSLEQFPAGLSPCRAVACRPHAFLCIPAREHTSSPP